MSTTIRILLASFLLQSAATNGEVLLSTLNNRQNSPPLHAAIGNYFGEDRAVSFSVQTGNNPDGYLLNSVTFNLGDASGSPDYFLIGVSETFLIDTPAVLLGNSIPRRAGRYTYPPQFRYFLKPNTEYLFSAVAFGNTWNNYFLLPVTTADERVRSSDGWRITYTVALASRASGNEAIAEGGVPLIAIDATKISPPKPTPPPLSGDATLRSLALSGVPINFASNINSYSASVSHTTASTTVIATPNEPTARVSISPNDANPNSAGHQVRLAEGNNSIAITVTAPNGNSRAYTIAVRRALPPLSGDASLRSLSLSGIPLNFASNINHYSAAVSHPTFSTTVTAISNEPKASVSITPADANAATPGHQVALAEGNNAIVVTVIAPNGNSRAYTIAVRRALPQPTPTPLPPPTPPTPTPQPKPSLSIRRVGNLIDIRWSGGTLQHSPTIAGPWKDVHVSSPLQLNRSWWRSSEFFRVR